jgi:hypothetical protein
MRVAGEAVRAFDNDRLRAATEKPLEHFREAWTVAHGSAPLTAAFQLDDLVARGPRVGSDRRALALVAVLVRANVRST